jgi:hypothetical protein
MVRDVEVMTDAVDEVMAMVADVGMIMVAVVTLVPWEQTIMVEDKELKWLTKVIMVEAEIMALNMVMDLVVEHIVIDYLGCWHCLLVLFMDLSKR